MMRAFFLTLWIAVGACCAHADANEPTYAIVGGTIIDVRDFGRSTIDVEDSIVVLRGDRIIHVGRRLLTKIPDDAVVDTKNLSLTLSSSEELIGLANLPDVNQAPQGLVIDLVANMINKKHDMKL